MKTGPPSPSSTNDTVAMYLTSQNALREAAETNRTRELALREVEMGRSKVHKDIESLNNLMGNPNWTAEMKSKIETMLHGLLDQHVVSS